MHTPDTILINGLEVLTYIGVPDEERAEEQALRVFLEIETPLTAAAASDDVAQTIDYAAVCAAVRALAAERPRKLIETLAEEIAWLVLSRFGAEAVTISIRKFILPETESVGLKIRRLRDS